MLKYNNSLCSRGCSEATIHFTSKLEQRFHKRTRSRCRLPLKVDMKQPSEIVSTMHNSQFDLVSQYNVNHQLLPAKQYLKDIDKTVNFSTFLLLL